MQPFPSEAIRPLAIAQFRASGRGPSLQRVVWSRFGLLFGFEYHRIDDPHDAAHLRHVRVLGPQVVMYTPEEVINYSTWGTGFGQHRGAGALDLGRSDWLRSFNPLHLGKCHHFQLLFYDELYDIICEDLEFGEGVLHDE